MAEHSIVSDPTIFQLIVIGAVGGGVAAVSATAVTWISRFAMDRYLMGKIYNWLKANCSEKQNSNNRYRSTRAIASWNNLTEDQVRDLCSRSGKIHLSTGSREDMWGVHERAPLNPNRFC